MKNRTRPYLYFAYGSNLNLTQMSHRCPHAEFVGRYTLHNWRLVFRGVADVIEATGETCVGALFRITESDEVALDRYEGYPRLYGKDYVRDIRHGTIMFYTMNDAGWGIPYDGYYNCIAQGYQDCELPMKRLVEALEFTRDLIRLTPQAKAKPPHQAARFAPKKKKKIAKAKKTKPAGAWVPPWMRWDEDPEMARQAALSLGLDVD